MDLNKSNKLVYVQSVSASASRPNKEQKERIVVNGSLKIQRPYCQSFAERIRIGVNIRANSKPRPTCEWLDIIYRKTPLTVNKKQFQIDQNYWFSTGINWVIPTPVFDESVIKISLEPSALSTTGFIVEVLNRDSTIVHEVQPDVKFAAGAENVFRNKWNVTSNTSLATPTITAADWDRFNSTIQQRASVNQPSTSNRQSSSVRRPKGNESTKLHLTKQIQL